MLLAEMSWDEVEAYLERDDRVVLPLGATEQHGRAGVLGTDHIIARGLAQQLSQRTGTVSAPVLTYGVSEHHMAFGGTVTVRPTTYIALVQDLIESLHRHGFRRVLLLNGHGGNDAPLQCALLELCNRHLDLRARQLMWWHLPGVAALERELFGSPRFCHACPGELSLAAALHPTAHRERQVAPGPDRPWSRELCNRDEQRRLFPDGVLGPVDQSRADAELGRRLLEHVLQQLEPLYREL